MFPHPDTFWCFLVYLYTPKSIVNVRKVRPRVTPMIAATFDVGVRGGVSGGAVTVSARVITADVTLSNGFSATHNNQTC